MKVLKNQSLTSKQRPWIWLLLSLFIIFLDQLTKWLAVKYLLFNQPVKIFNYLNFTLRYNKGVAFSFLSSYSGSLQVYLLSLVAILISIGLFVWLCRLKTKDSYLSAAVCLVIGGALGNVIDRVRLSYVIDFIDFHIGTWHYATFNVADSAICIGAFLLIYRMIFFSAQTKRIKENQDQHH